MPRRAGLVLLLWVLTIPVLGLAPWARAQEGPTVAVVTLPGIDPGLGGLLMEQLNSASADRLRWVDRMHVRRVLAEQELAAMGLMDPRTTIRIGQFIGADVLLIAESLETDPQHRWIHLRLVETRTGLVLEQHLLPGTPTPESLKDSARSLRAALAKAGRPLDQRVHLAVLEFHREEPGPALEPLARALTGLVPLALRRTPDVVLLERHALRRLADERDLAGVELELRASTVLVQGSVRHGERNGEAMITLRLTRLAGEDTASIVNVQVPLDNPRAAQQRIADVILGHLGIDGPAGSVPTSPAEEAAHLVRQARWLSTHREHDVAISMAEAALALAPSQETREAVRIGYGSVLRDTSRPVRERLLAARRYNEIELAMVDALAPDPRAIHQFPGLISGMFSEPQLDDRAITDPEDRRLLEDSHKLCGMKYERMLGIFREHRMPVAQLLATRVDYPSLRAAGSAAEAAEVIRSVLEQIADAEPSRDIYLQHMPRRLCRSIDLLWGRWQEQAEQITPLLTAMAEGEDPAWRLTGLYGLAHQLGRPGVEAAVAWLTAAHELEAGSRIERLVNDTRGSIILRLNAAPELDSWLDGLLDAAEETDDVRNLTRWPNLVSDAISRAAEGPAFARRVIQLLEPREPRRDIPAEANAWLLLANARYQLGLREVAANPWDRFLVRPINLERDSSVHGFLVCAHLDADPAAESLGGEFVLLWRNTLPPVPVTGPTYTYTVARAPIAGGKQTVLGSFKFLGIAPVSMTAAKQTVFIGTNLGGVFVVGPAGTRHYTQRQGLPSDNIGHVAFLGDWLYLAHHGAVSRLDPDTGAIELIASSRRLDARHALDGGSPYEIRGILADPEHQCLWLSIRDPFHPHRRSGLWRLNPDTPEARRVIEGDTTAMAWQGQRIFLMRGGAPGLFDPGQEVFAVPQDYTGQPFFPPLRPGDRVLLPGMVIGHGYGSGVLRTLDGQIHRIPIGAQHSQFFQQGRGFVAAKLDASAKLLYAEPAAEAPRPEEGGVTRPD